MAEILSALPQLTALIEKGGIIGLLVVICAFLAWEVRRLRADLARTYEQRDQWRLRFVKAKSACDSAGIKLDLSDLGSEAA